MAAWSRHERTRGAFQFALGLQPKGHEQIVVLDLAANAVDGTLEFIERGGIQIVHT